jgi:hypothetical protein
MSFLVRWLNLARDRRPVGLRPHRDVVVEADFDATFDRVLRGMDGVLGAYVAAQDRDAGTIEAAFGLVNNERVRCTLQRTSGARTDVRIEAYFPAGSSVREHSRAVDALADYLERTSKPV